MMDEIEVEDIQEDPIASPHVTSDIVEPLMLASQFRIDSPTDEEKGKLATVWELAKELSKTKENYDVVWQVKHLMMTLGAPTPGESSLDRIYRYAKLKRQEQMIQSELKNGF